MRKLPLWACAGLIIYSLFLSASAIRAEVGQELQAPKSVPLSPEKEALQQKISETTMSPYCPGRTLSACPSSEARALRNRIHEWLAQGYSEQAVRNQLLSMFGSDVRGAPESSGFGLVAWVAPTAFLLFLSVLIVLVLQSLKRKEQNSVTPAPDAMPSDLKDSIEREIQQRLQS